MYIPNANREDDRDTLLAFMRAHNFATLVSQVEGAPFATHLPVTLAVEGDALVCYGHFAKANPQWRTLGDQTTLLMFGGPHAYVSPQWYEKAENVPTWNYMAVHAYGTARLMDSTTEREAVLSVIADLIGQHEPSYQAQWDSLSDKYRDGMLQGIVGFVLTVERLEGKYKLSQNRTPTDQTTVADHLLASPDSSASAIGAAMRAKLDQHG
jgi:transcriptional regulator